MKTGWLPVTGWGAAIVALAVFGTLVFDLGTLPTLLWAGAGALCMLFGLWAWVAGRRPRPGTDGEPQVVIDLSMASLTVAVGVTLMLTGAAAIGPAVFWPGVGVTVLGLGGIAREVRASREALRRAKGAERRGSAR